MDELNVIEVNITENGTGIIGTLCDGIEIPKAQDLFRQEPWWNFSILVAGSLLALATIVIYVEEVVYIIKHFESSRRRTKTIWVLALYPVYSVTGLLGVLVPRAGTLVDLVGNVYFATVLYQFVRLMIDYIGGQRNMWQELGETTVSLRGPPFCCCCFCLPEVHFGPPLFRRLELLVMQVAFVRPFLMFIAAVLWANGSYQPGVISWDNGFVYIMVLNLCATFTAVYGLLLIQKTFAVVLQSYHLGGKFLSLQLVLLLTALVNVIISILVTNDVIPCTTVLSSKTRGERLYHSILVLLMLPLSLLGRGFYRRKEEGKIDPRFRRRPHPVDHKEMMTSTASLNNNAGSDEPEVIKREIFPDAQFNNNSNNIEHTDIPFMDDHRHHPLFVHNTSV